MSTPYLLICCVYIIFQLLLKGQPENNENNCIYIGYEKRALFKAEILQRTKNQT